MNDITRQAGSALLGYATDAGLWRLAREAAESLAQDPVGAKEWYPHFVLGKSARMTQDFEVALAQYTEAEAVAIHPKERDVARYERASVLCELGRREEADPLYAELADSSDPATRVEARVALALGVADRGDVPAAMSMLEDAAELANKAGVAREEAEVWQAMGVVLAQAERWTEARVRIKRAHTLRFALGDDQARDIYGWYHLFRIALGIERALGNHAAARSAARGVWRCAVLSGSIAWEANAAHAMCLTDPDASDSEIQAAVARLKTISRDAARSAVSRLAALEGLVLSEWSLHHYDSAIEAIAEIAAIGEESRISTPIFAHLVNSSDGRENIVAMPGGGYGLLIPSGKTEDFIAEVASRVFENRPELAKYSVLLKGRWAGGSPPRRRKGRARRKGKKNKKRRKR